MSWGSEARLRVVERAIVVVRLDDNEEVAGLALAASILLFWRLASFSPDVLPKDSNPIAEESSSESNPDAEIALVPIDLTEPLARLELELDAIDTEIAQLKDKAALLDARRRADELLAGAEKLSLQSVVLGEQE